MSKQAKQTENVPAKVEPQNTAVATQADRPQAVAGILATDVIIPQLLLMQGTSDFVKERKANLGDIVRSTSAEKVGDPDGAIDFIPLAPPRAAWVLEQKNAAGKFEYHKTMPRTAANETLPWNYFGDKDGNEVAQGTNGSTEWRRVKRLSLFAILPKDIDAEAAEMAKAAKGEMPDLSKALTPVMISFRSTSFNAGKDVVTFFTQAASFRMDAWKYMLKLTCFLDKNDQGSFYVWKVDRTKPLAVKPESLETVKRWAEIVNGSNDLKVDEAADSEATGPAPAMNNGVC